MQYRMPDVTIMSYEKHQPQLADDVFVASGARLIGDIIIGAASSIWFNSVIRADVQAVRIGRMTNIQDNAVVHVTEGGLATLIGDEVTIGHNAIIHAARVHDGALIGMGATVLDGVVVGEGCLVGAGALLPPGRHYPPRSLIVGSPAIVKRQLTDQEYGELQKSARHYAALRLKYVSP